MTILGPLHLALLSAIAAVAVVLVQLCRRGMLNAGRVCFVLGLALAADEAAWWIWVYSHEGVHPGNLPLQLCDAVILAAAIACLTRNPPLAEFAYFAGMAGAGMALISPDLAGPWPTWPALYFFVAHGEVVTAASMLAFSGVMRFEPRSVWRPFGLLLGYAAFAGILDAGLDANYMYLRSKPVSASLLNVMGPWPWYIASGAGLVLVLFWLLWLPVRPTAAKRVGPEFGGPASAHAHR